MSKTDYKAKFKDVEDKIPSNTGLTTTTALTFNENKKKNVNDLVKKKKKIMKQKYKVFRRDISPHLIIISLRVVYFIQR